MLKGCVERVVQDGVSEVELEGVKRASQVSLYSSLQSNSSMAAVLASYHAIKGEHELDYLYVRPSLAP